MNDKYCGCWTALVTPFTDEFNVDWGQLERNVEFQIQQGLTGLLPMGSTGESATVTHEEHSKIISKIAAQAKGKCLVLAGTGSNSTQEALHETAMAVDAGVDASLLVDCYYNKPSSMELRREYYDVVLSKFPDLDFIAYAIPGRSVTVIAPEDLALLRDSHNNLVGVKEATGDFNRMQATRELLDDDFNIISGDDPNTLRMMTDAKINASGVISVISNITPAPIEKYTRLVLGGKADEAKKIDEALAPLFSVVGVSTTEKVTLPNGVETEVEYKFPNPVAVKTMMAGLGMQDYRCKRPLGRLTKQGVDIIRSALRTVWESAPEYLTPVGGFYDVDVGERISCDKHWESLSY